MMVERGQPPTSLAMVGMFGKRPWDHTSRAQWCEGGPQMHDRGVADTTVFEREREG